MVKLNKEFINNLPEISEKEKTFWDDELTGFGLRVQGKSKTWIIMYRNQFNKQRKMSIGKIHLLTPTEARNLAKQKLANIVANGADPAFQKTSYKNDMTIAELCDLYLQEGTLNKKPSTIMNDKSRIERHIKPLIGHFSIKELQKEHIMKMMVDISNGKTAFKSKSNKPRGIINVIGGKSIAKRTLEMLSSILSFAKIRGIIDNNPALGVPKPKTQKREVFLTSNEIKEFGKALKLAEEQYLCSPAIIDAIKLLILTGCRKNEILSLKWEYIDFNDQCFRFPDTKTGAQTRAFGIEAKHILKKLQQNSYSEWVFPASHGLGHFVGISKNFNKICKLTDNNQQQFIKKDICIHTLRHTFASMGANMGYNELIIAGLLGHKLGGVTNRYCHTVDKTFVLAADTISSQIKHLLD